MLPLLLSSRVSAALVIGALFISPVAAASAQSALERSTDGNIKPGDDFFAYANGSWLRATSIPAGKQKWSTREEIFELTRQQVAKLYDDARTAPHGSLARRVSDFHASLLSDPAIDAHSLSRLKPALDSIDQINDRTALTRALGHDVGADVDPLNWGVYRSSHVLGLSVEESIHGEKTQVAFLVQGGLGLPDRANYLSAEPAKQQLRAQYQAYIARVLALAGMDRAEPRAAAVMALETAMAQGQASLDASANDHNADSVWTPADFVANAPGMDWSVFLDAAGLAKEHSFVPWQPSAMRSLAAIVASQPLDTWRDYLRFHMLHRYAEMLPVAFAGAARELRVAEGLDKPDTNVRARRALEATQLYMGDAIGQLYAERYFPAAQKARVEAIVANVRAAFTRRVEASTWMTPASRAIALAKLKKLYVGVAYPDHWQDYSDLRVDPNDPVGNLQRASDRDYRRTLARLGTAIDTREWWLAAQVPGAILTFQLNSYVFAAALMQPPKYDPSASDAAAYGAIGAIIGHDVVHYVDILGADYDTDGAMRHWWTADDMQHYRALSQPLVNQFTGYEPLPGAHVDGKLTESENIADLGGLSAAFDAYRVSLGSRINDKAYVHQQDREFFIAFAQAWRSRLTDAGMRTQLANDHAPEMYRIATVRNLDAWYDAFDVRPGQKLWLDPAARVRIW